MRQKPDVLINEALNLLEEIIPIQTRNIQMLQNDVPPEGSALQFLLQQEIENQENVLRRTKELQETVHRFLNREIIDDPPKSHVGHITVILPNGREICHRNASDTFAEVIEEIGIEKVKNLDLTMSGIPLIATTRHPTYNHEPSGKYYITTHSNTNTKIERLNEIKRRLDFNLEVIDNRNR